MDTVKAILTKPLDGQPEGTAREFDRVDFDRLEAMNAVREAGDDEGLRQDGPTIAEYLSAGYKAENYPPAGYAARSTPEEIAAAQAAEISSPIEPPMDDTSVVPPELPVAPQADDSTSSAGKKAATTVQNKKAPAVNNKTAE
ncbi:hypothetical protein [Tianweitania sediminis]|uniref:Uncharacterized protein n=1 Tax=Tianweitania sediminis TaxID=1502156 RepID=A0A8J7UKJ1_9HYPH|nr:hypothetical protein [Tianweitania sediminis]MBP0438427.1 hypothetical protein [Tianweitania sediminis]